MQMYLVSREVRFRASLYMALLLLLICCSFCMNGIFADDPPVPAGVANKKVSVSEVSFDSHVEDIQWCGADHRTILLKTRKGRLYRSKDGGKVWVEITDLLKTSGDGVSVAVDTVMISPVDKNIVVVVGAKRSHFVSEDAATTFRKIRYTSTIHNFHFHPTRQSFALVSTWTESCYNKSIAKKGSECNHQLWYTSDLGRNFKLVGDYVVQFSWGDKTVGNSDTIFFTQHRGKTGDQPRYGGWSKNVDLMMTKDFGSTVDRLVYRGNKFLLSNGYFFVAKVKDALQQTVALLVSTDGGKNFSPARLPVEIEERSYTVLDTSEGAIMLHVNHGGDIGKDQGNVYISDAKGIRYALSLPNNIRTSSGECEFDKVLSLEGVYIANFRDTLEPTTADEGSVQVNSSNSSININSKNSNNSNNPDPNEAAENLLVQEEEAEAEPMESMVDKKHEKASNRARTQQVTRTVISLDKGGMWSYLKPPKVDSRGQQINCPPDNCWLHLNGITKFSEFAPFYSVENAVGIIMGTGNVGSFLRSSKEEVNTYLSRDGGLTWIEAHKGAFIYEMGDHGGLLVMADDTKQTNQVVFSWNEGQSWYDFELGSLPLFVDNIVIEPNASSVEFLLYGKREGDAAGILFHLDFGALNQQACKGIFSADSVSSDYETWSPSDGRTLGEKCILGKHLTYTRRKQTSECFNGRDFNRPKSVKICQCTMQDYECEFGFTRPVGSLTCQATDAAAAAAVTAAGLSQFADEEDIAAAAECTSSSFFYTSAYRKVPGDVCEGGWVPEKVAVPCPSHSPVSKGGKFVLLLIILIVIIMFVFNYLAKSGKIQAFMRNAGFDRFANVPYALVGPPSSWLEEGELKRGKEMHCGAKFEPELSFIDAEQDEHEEDAPRLLDYRATAKPGQSNSRTTSSNNNNTNNEEFEFNDTFSSNSGATNRRNLGASQAPFDIPRLAPPSFDDDSVELL